MKKLLLILALLAYAAISCDKPETTFVDEPETEAPAAVDTAADTCVISFQNGNALTPVVVMLYRNQSNNVDFDASVKSIFQHYTIALKDGSYDSAIAHNCRFEYGSTFDSGHISSVGYTKIASRLKYGDYLVVIWNAWWNGAQWGPNYYDATQRFFYRDIVLDEQHTFESILLDEKFEYLMDSSEPLSFTKF